MEEVIHNNNTLKTRPMMDSWSISAIRAHMSSCLEFYHQNGCMDPEGGFYHYYYDNGIRYQLAHRHLVSSTRFIFVNAMGWMEFRDPRFLHAVQHGLEYLRSRHLQDHSGGYVWTIKDGIPEDTTNHCYGIAFCLLAYSTALSCQIHEAKSYLEGIWDLLERFHFKYHMI